MRKKNENRFTIKFNPANPRHKEAMRILDEAGRRKASLIADALCMFNHYGIDMNADLKRSFPNPINGELSPAVSTNVFQGTSHAPLTDDSWATINESLDGFF